MNKKQSESQQRSQAFETYNVNRWGGGYFSVNSLGHLQVSPTTQETDGCIDTVELAKALKAAGLRWPVLVRYPGVIRHRVLRLCQAFEQARQDLDYAGGYHAVYPIKVNQQRRVVEEVISAGEQPSCTVGLEAGSKPELLAVMAMAPSFDTILVCNGYKDPEYIRLALIGVKLGYKLFIVIEKLSELSIVMAEAQKLNVEPLLGVRARLASIGKGNWQNTGGEKSKFGLSADQILQVVQQLESLQKLHTLTLLHFHLGSQIANIRDIRSGLQECGRFFSELCAIGVPISTIDVGGGLGVDYEGTGSRSACSMNYSLEEYAAHVVRAFKDAASQSGVSPPSLITESGRALTAHHAMLITNLIDAESVLGHEYGVLREDEEGEEKQDRHRSYLADAIQGRMKNSNTFPFAIQELLSMLTLLQSSSIERVKMIETYHDITFQLGECQAQFIHGSLTIKERAMAESIALAAYSLVRASLDISNRNHREIFDELNEKLADKLFVNFSLFQSLPDVWGIKQIFPVMPLDHLHEPVQRRVVVQDITCDSDGRMDLYVDGQGLESTLPMPAVAQRNHEKELLLGFCLVGAYQEILGDMHNLFGDSDAVDVVIDHKGRLKLENLVKGDSVETVLNYVNFDVQRLRQAFHHKLQIADLSENERLAFFDDLQAGLSGYTYLDLENQK